MFVYFYMIKGKLTETLNDYLLPLPYFKPHCLMVHFLYLQTLLAFEIEEIIKASNYQPNFIEEMPPGGLLTRTANGFGDPARSTTFPFA